MTDGWDGRGHVADCISIGVLLALSESRLAELQELYDLLDATLPRLEFGPAERALRAPGVTVFAAVDRATNRIVGVATLVTASTVPRMRAWAEDLVVHPDFRRRGIAEALMDTCAEAATDSGARLMEGTVHPTRTAAIALHTRAGWDIGSSLTAKRHLTPRAAPP